MNQDYNEPNKCRYYPYAAAKAERQARYEDAACLYKYAATEADCQDDRITHLENYHRCKQLAKENPLSYQAKDVDDQTGTKGQDQRTTRGSHNEGPASKSL